MKVRFFVEGRTRHFELTLSDQDLQDLLTGIADPLVGYSPETQSHFFLYPNMNRFDDSFQLMHDNSGYFAYVCGDIRKEGDLERAIESKGKMPIEMPSVIPGDRKPINLGYVILKLEKESTSAA